MSKVNETCGDLTYIKMQNSSLEGFLVFCQSLIYDDYGEINQTIYTIVSIELQINSTNNQEKPFFRYLQIINPVVDFDFQSGFQFLGYEQSDTNETIVILLANVVQNLWTYYTQQVIVRFNYKFYDVMKTQNKTSMFISQCCVFDIKYQILFDQETQNKRVAEFELINDNIIQVAFTFEQYGVVLCDFTRDIFNQTPKVIFPISIRCDKSKSYLWIPLKNALKVHWNILDPQYFYIATSTPPGVIEVSIQDPYNALIKEIYNLDQDKPEYVGLKSIATNKFFVVHQMLNVQTNSRILRIYNRNSSRMDMAKYEFQLPSSSRPNFMAFPNVYQSMMLIRDERRINVTVYNDISIQIDGRNHTKIEKYKYNRFNVSLVAKNSFKSIATSFIVRFVDSNFTSVFASGLGVQNHDIFYNCGDESFSYPLTDYFNGPSFDLKIDDKDCNNGSCFFSISNSELKKVNKTQDIRGNGCEVYFIFPNIDILIDDQEEYMTFICINPSNSTVSSFKINQATAEVVSFNEIEIPEMKSQKYGFDIDDRTFFIIAQVGDSESNYTKFQNEVHFFSVLNEMIWTGFYQWQFIGLFDYQGIYSLDDILIMRYNWQINVGLMISTPQYSVISGDFQLIIYYKIDYDQHSTFKVTSVNKYKMDNKNTFPIIMAAISSESFAFCFSTNQILSIYQITDTQQQLQLVTQRKLDIADTPLDIEIHDNFFVAYYKPNIIIVYEIVNNIHLQYKMRLPLYEAYKHFYLEIVDGPKVHHKMHSHHFFHHFNSKYSISETTNVKQTYYNSFLSVIMYNSSANLNGFEFSKGTYQVFTYQLTQNQHNALMMVKDVSDFYLESKSKSKVDLQLIGLRVNNSLVLMSDTKFALYDAKFLNFLKLSSSPEHLAQLKSDCSQYKILDHENNQDDGPQLISKLKIIAQSNLNKVMKTKTYNKLKVDYNNSIMINVYTQNLGIIITPQQNITKRNYTYSASNQVGRLTNMSLSVQDILDGYNMSYELNCIYYDYDSNIQNCPQGSVQDYSRTYIFSYYIEFVTQKRQVIYCVSLQNIYIMFDSMNLIHFLRLPSTDVVFSQSNLALESYGDQQFKQDEQLQCKTDQFIGVEFYESDLFDPIENSTYTLYVLIYECKIKEANYIKLSWLKIYDLNSNQEEEFEENKVPNYEFKVVEDSLRMTYTVIDIQRQRLPQNENSTDKIYSRLAITLDVPGSQSNILTVYDVAVDTSANRAQFKQQLIAYCDNLKDKNSFKVTFMYNIPSSKIVFIIDKTYGVYIYDLENLQILHELDLRQDNDFIVQSEKVYGPLEVYNIAGNMPYSVHVLTNLGIFIYDFDVDLTDREQVINGNLKYKDFRVIRYYFTLHNQEITQNDFGYAFLTKKEHLQGVYDIYLSIVSFDTSPNSQFFRQQKIQSNNIQGCHSLNLEDQQYPFGRDNGQDSLVVSFICNTQLYLAQAFFRPYFVIELHGIENGTKYSKGHHLSGAMQFNTFNMSLKAKNEFYEEDEKPAEVELVVHQKFVYSDFLPVYYIVLITIVSAFMLLFTLIDQTCSKGKYSWLKKKVVFDEQQEKQTRQQMLERTSGHFGANKETKRRESVKLLNLQEINKSTTIKVNNDKSKRISQELSFIRTHLSGGASANEKRHFSINNLNDQEDQVEFVDDDMTPRIKQFNTVIDSKSVKTSLRKQKTKQQ